MALEPQVRLLLDELAKLHPPVTAVSAKPTRSPTLYPIGSAMGGIAGGPKNIGKYGQALDALAARRKAFRKC